MESLPFIDWAAAIPATADTCMYIHIAYVSVKGKKSSSPKWFGTGKKFFFFFFFLTPYGRNIAFFF